MRLIHQITQITKAEQVQFVRDVIKLTNVKSLKKYTERYDEAIKVLNSDDSCESDLCEHISMAVAHADCEADFLVGAMMSELIQLVESDNTQACAVLAESICLYAMRAQITRDAVVKLLYAY